MTEYGVFRLFTSSSIKSDNRILECALKAKVDFIITGNKKHFPFEEFKGSKIVTPREFIGKIGKEIKAKD